MSNVGRRYYNHHPKIEHKRTQISERQLQILETMYKDGMTSKGKTCEAMQRMAVEKTDLPLQVVKDWIGNKNKTESGRKYVYHKSSYTKGMSAFNSFVSEKKEQFEKISDWAPAWNRLSDEEKDSYRIKAKEQMSHQDKPSAAKSLLKQIFKLVVDIGLCGVDLAVLGVDKNDGKEIFFGEEKTGAFFSSHPKVLEDLYYFHSFSTGSETKETKLSLKELRKKAQDHMNELYSIASGKSLPFPYKKVTDGQIAVHGFPETLQPLRTVSNYGEKNLNLILSVKEIFIESIAQNQEIVADGRREEQAPVLDLNQTNSAVTSEISDIDEINYNYLEDIIFSQNDVESHVQTKENIKIMENCPHSKTQDAASISLDMSHDKKDTAHQHTKTHDTAKISQTQPISKSHNKKDTAHQHTKTHDTAKISQTQPISKSHNKKDTAHQHTKTHDTAKISQTQPISKSHNKKDTAHQHTKTHDTAKISQTQPISKSHNKNDTAQQHTKTHNTACISQTQFKTNSHDKKDTAQQHKNTKTHDTAHKHDKHTTNPQNTLNTSPSQQLHDITKTQEKIQGKREKRKLKEKQAVKKKAKKEFIVGDILDVRVEDSGRMYLVHWDGYTHEEDSWEPEGNIPSVLIGQFYAKKNS